MNIFSLVRLRNTHLFHKHKSAAALINVLFERHAIYIGFINCITYRIQKTPLGFRGTKDRLRKHMFRYCWKTSVFFPVRQSLFYFLSGAGKFSPAHGLRQLTCDGKSGVESLNFMSHATCIRHHEKPNDVRRRSLCDIKCQTLKKLLMVNYNFQCHR